MATSVSSSPPTQGMSNNSFPHTPLLDLVQDDSVIFKIGVHTTTQVLATTGGKVQKYLWL